MKISYEPFEKKRDRGIGPWVRRLILAWLTACAAEMCFLPAAMWDLKGLEGLAQMSAGRMAGIAGVVFVLMGVMSRLVEVRTAERWMLVAVYAVLAGLSLAASFTWAFLAVCLLVLVFLTVYALWGWNGRKIRVPVRMEEDRAYIWLVVIGAAAFFLLVSVWTVCRVYSFSTPSYDFSIFAQMFHSMRTTGQPVTTIERDGALSHFAVHMSPVYYLLLPVYWLIPVPAMLQVLQAAVLTSAVIPLWKLGRLYGLNPLARSILCLTLLLYPAYAGGASYDIHENAFLTPLILWLFYGIDRKNGLLTTIAAALTLMVKEDAAVYVAVVALYLILRSVLKKQKWGMAAGVMMLAGAVAYFVVVTGYLAESGDGVMTYRYKNFMYDGSDSLLTVIKAVLLNPMMAVFECVDVEKLEFIGLTLLPLAGLPFITRRYERFLLLIPYALVNLMSDYQYQHDIFFQYTYGSAACLFYSTLVNLADMKPGKKQLAALFVALCIGTVCFGVQVLPKAMRYPSYCVTYSDSYDDLRETLDTIPDGASVAATTFYTTHLSQRDVLYDVRYASKDHLLSCEYVAINPKEEKSLNKYGGHDGLLELLLENGYEKYAECGEKLEIYRRNVS